MVVRTRVRWSTSTPPQARQRLSQVSRSSRPADSSGNPSLEGGESCLSVIIHGSCTEVFGLSGHRGDLDSDCFAFPGWQEGDYKWSDIQFREGRHKKCVLGVQKWGPESQTGLIFTGNSRKIYFFLHFCMTECNILPSVFWYLWRWLGPSDAFRLNSI